MQQSAIDYLDDLMKQETDLDMQDFNICYKILNSKVRPESQQVTAKLNFMDLFDK